MKIISHNNGAGARALSELISNGRLVNKRSTAPLRDRDRVLINFGYQGTLNRINDTWRVFNRPECVAAASDKLQSFNIMKETRRHHLILPFTTNRDEVLLGIAHGQRFYARTLTRGSEGRGIVILDRSNVNSIDDIVHAPMYTRHIRKAQEYRVHVGKHTADASGHGAYVIIDVQRKAKRHDVTLEGDARFIWNHSNGFVFSRQDVTPDSVPQSVLEVARWAARVHGLDFAAVDVLVPHESLNDRQAKVIEVNTAPGLEGTTLERYADYFRGVTTGSGRPREWADRDFSEWSSEESS